MAFPCLSATTPNPSDPIRKAHSLIESGEQNKALALLMQGLEESPDDPELLVLASGLLVSMERIGEADALVKRRPGIRALQEIAARIEEALESATASRNKAIVLIGKKIDDADYASAILIIDRALEKFPRKRGDLLALKGESLYKNNDLEAAEEVLREALRIDPFNAVAKSYVEEIRTTEEAQTSEELAEWISIAKDKVGDFIVTFLALFAAFLVNSLVAPILLRINLNQARKSFERGDYDEFTDLIEGLLDKESFAILRSNFRFILEQKGYEEAREILNRHVVTVERLPSLLRILEREHEKMQASEAPR